LNMKIAILLVGHLRFWKECRSNFLSCLYQDGYDIDVFVDTYYQMFRSDYSVRKENENCVNLTSSDIHALFRGINVVSFKIEPELLGGESMQVRKLLNVYDTYVNYENDHGKYDLVIKSRFDIKLHNTIDYLKLSKELSSLNKILHLSRGAVNSRPSENDMLAIGDTDTFKIYGNRHRRFSCVHGSLGMIQKEDGVKCIPDIDISILRFSHDGTKIVEEH
jgi:hypothetical protein